MAFGLTEDGFILKRLEDIKTELENDYREAFGEINVNPDSVFGQIIGIMSRHLSEIWEQAENVYFAFYPGSAFGFSLDGVVQLNGIIRLSSTESEVVCQCRGTQGTLIPDLTKVSQSDQGTVFEQVNNVLITREVQHKTVITVDSTDDGLYTVTIDGVDVSFTASSNTEAEIAEALSSAINAEIAINEKVESAYNSGDAFFTLTIKNEIGVSGSLPLTVDRYYSVLLTPPTANGLLYTELWSPGFYRSVIPGNFTVPLGSVNTIETPISGFAEITNFEDGIPGRDPEADVDLRTRRIESLQIAGAATVGAIIARVGQEVAGVTQVGLIENREDTWDPGPSPIGRPPHSIEVIVVGGDEQAIADKIWEVKAAGIQTYGNTSRTVIDGNGDPQEMFFSRPTTVYTYVRIDYDKTGAEDPFPSDGEDTMRDNIYTLGITHDIGEDVLIQRFFKPIYEIQGFTSAEIYLAEDALPDNPTPSWVQANIEIAPQSVAIFANDTLRIVINDVTP